MPYKITFTNTKSKKNRTVPISKELFDMLPKKRGRLFNDAYESFENAVLRAEIELPKGQLTHVLRHTFASHFMMNGGNILVLKEILGHSTIEMTMHYAHFAPSHLESAVKFNPLFNPLYFSYFLVAINWRHYFIFTFICSYLLLQRFEIKLNCCF